jgi:hypothetical protein
VGFQRIDLECQVSDGSKEITLQLVQRSAEGALDFEENAGDVFLSDLVSGLNSEFDRKKYRKGTRDIFQLVQRLNWRPELKQLKHER